MSGRTPFSKQGITQNTDARSRGLQLALALHPTESFLLRGFWSYFRAELTEDAPGLLPEGADAFKGDRTPGAPEHRAGVIVSKSMRLSDNIHLELSHDYAWVGSVLTRIGGREGGERLPAYGVHGLSASLSSESSAWTATLYAENLLDEYAVYRGPEPRWISAQPTVSRCAATRPTYCRRGARACVSGTCSDPTADLRINFTVHGWIVPNFLWIQSPAASA